MENWTPYRIDELRFYFTYFMIYVISNNNFCIKREEIIFRLLLRLELIHFNKYFACKQISIWCERVNCWMNYSNHFNATILNNIFHILLKHQPSGSEKRNEINKLLHFTVSSVKHITRECFGFCRYSTCAFSCICIDENIWRQQLHQKKKIHWFSSSFLSFSFWLFGFW